jgi:formylglycine-generating enzyme required for sulfatase activity
MVNDRDKLVIGTNKDSEAGSDTKALQPIVPSVSRGITRRALGLMAWSSLGTAIVIVLGRNNSHQPAVSPSPTFDSFTFNTVKLNSKGEIIARPSGKATYFQEDLGGITLDMVKIPGGTFKMGAVQGEESSSNSEFPQHEVKVKEFWMGRFTVTQQQWKAIALLPKVKIDLEADPSKLKGDKLPVEQVSLNQAKEFCDRLSQKTGKTFDLPTEAQWEYACRAGTTTPFHFGETITTDVANFDGFNGNYMYAKASKGIYRQKTIAVDSFDPNAFGLYNMHGNVWELCLDSWHPGYTNAPNDGSAWDADNGSGIMRGGSWVDVSGSCRSVSRVWAGVWYDVSVIGFRVVYSSERIVS